MEKQTPPLLSFREYNSDILLRRASFLLLALTAVFFSIRQIYGEDIPFHLNAGRWILENVSFPDKDTFTYTANDHEYTDLNWLYQVFMYGVYSLAGANGLILINALFVLGSVLLLFKRTSASFHLLHPWIFLSAILAVSPILEIRPHSVSWLLLSLSLWILQQYYEGNSKAIRWLPLIMIIWVNCHSLFILGWVVMGCYGVSVFLRKKELLKEYLTWTGAAVLICFLNPYGWKGLAFPFEQIMLLQEGNVFKENIRELLSPFEISEYAFTSENLLSKWHFFDLFLLFSVVGVLIRLKKLQVHEWLIVIIFFYFAFSATKNIGYFVFAITPIIANSFAGKTSESSSKKKHKDPSPKNYNLQIGIAFLLLSTLLILGIRSNAFYIHYRSIYRFGLGWNESSIPVKATDFLIRNKLNGKMLNQLDLGGYQGFFTKNKVAIDGRLEVMGAELFAEQVKSVDADDKKALIDKYDPQIVIFSYHLTPDWIQYMIMHPEWRLGYVDASTAVYLKLGYAPGIPAVDEKAFAASLPVYSDEQIDSILNKTKDPSFFPSLFHTQYYPEDELNQAFFCIYYGWIPSAKQATALGFVKSGTAYPELYQNLGTIYYEYRDKNRTLFCYEKFLEKRKNEAIEKRVRYLKSL